MIYFDYAASTPMSESSLRVFTEASTRFFGNSSSLHDMGSNAEMLLEECRKQLAGYLNGDPNGVYFTSGGSESNHLAIVSLVRAHSHKGKHLITTVTEHPSVTNTFQLLEEEGFTVTKLPVDSTGRIRLQDLNQAITENTILVSIGHANSEIGTLQPLQEIGEILSGKGILFHSDCVQTFGKMPIDVHILGLDSISISSHKIYGPKGVGACYVSPQTHWKATIPGTSHEKGFRSGTVNVPGIAAFVTAAGDMIDHMRENEMHFRKLRDRVLTKLEGEDGFYVEGHPMTVLPSIIGLRVKGMEGQYIMLELNRRGFAVSTGSACSVGQQSPSKTMMAIGRTPDKAREFIRISLGLHSSADDIDSLLDELLTIATRNRTAKA
ncbi:IscS subfamily cysteine desulfurase [Pseudalkalibacillus sp. Hm43]|uniref:IscS subfamily cysteine desulfurase n=1 Tax=Pseudalkalibacillus sp. Hm43 TaxID=3450742 RepID=UPI003F435224